MPSLLSSLRQATSASHEILDSAFGSLDLNDRTDYVRFLRGHAIGLAPLFGSFRRFVEGELATACPDYPAMLDADLAALGEDIADAPAVSAPAALSGPATGYVIAGSRLGLAAISRHGYWGRTHGVPSAYMDDVRGLAIWKQAAAWLKDRELDEARARTEEAAAVAAFDTFHDAFSASALTTVR